MIFTKAKIQPILFTIIGMLTFSSCGEDRSSEAEKLQETQNWIYSNMEKWYYWYEDIPQANTLNFFDEPRAFFGKLLSEKDGKNKVPFSYIEDRSKQTETRSIAQTNYSYGFDFVLATLNQDPQIYGLITYISEDSPASEAKLHRGDLIETINGTPVSQSNASLLLGGPEVKLIVKRNFTQQNPITLGSARAVNDNPVYKVSRLNNGKVGYLMYNHFTPGSSNAKQDYDNALRDAAHKLLGVEDLILDLRYNNGGAVSSAEVLISILCPAPIVGQTVGYMQYSDKINKKVDIETSEKLLGGAPNLNLKSIYILTSKSTASASELVINSLKTYMTVNVIGQTTVGKNVGSIGFDRGSWHMQPIVCQIYNSKNQSDYAEGFEPGEYTSTSNLINSNYDIEESLPFVEIGDPTDPLINRALQLINGDFPRAKTRQSETQKLRVILNSVDLRRQNNLVVNPSFMEEFMEE